MEQTAKNKPMSKNSILIVEDQRDVRQMLRYALESTGRDFNVLDVPSGEEALLLLSRQKIHLMVVDIRLAGISGLELMEKARSRRPDLKVILITGITDPVMRQKIANAGADAYFYKPVPMADFLNRVDTCLGLASVENQDGIPEPVGEIKPAAKLAAVLSDFRQDSGVISILLLDGNSRVLAQSGDLPASVDQADLFASLVGAMRAGLQVADRLDCQEPEGLLFLSGKELDLIAATIYPSATLAALAAHQDAPGSREAMLNSLPAVVDKIRDLAIEGYLRTQESGRTAAMESHPGQSEGSVPQDQEMLSEAKLDKSDLQTKAKEQEMVGFAQDVKLNLQTHSVQEEAASEDPQALDQPPGEPEQTSRPEENVEGSGEEGHPDLDLLFQQDLDTEDIDNFWDTLADQDSGNSANPGILSYEQARRLGLTPDEGD
jgi:DNA-binding response OmpR family regulator